MTRVKISTAILAVLLVSGIFSWIWVNRNCMDFVNSIYAIEENFGAGDTDGATKKAENLERDWSNFRKTASMFLRNDKLLEIERLCASLSYLASSGSEDLPVYTEELRHMITLLRDGETPYLRSIL